MESVLAVLCIVFFAILTYGLVQGRNLTKDHLYNCRTLYIPEYIDLELAYKNVTDKNLDALKKRARELGASQKFVKRFDKDSDKTDLKKFIILNSISNEHILFDSIEDRLDSKETHKRELNNITTRVTNEVNNIPTPISPTKKKELYRDLDIDISGTDNEIKEQLIKKYIEQSISMKAFNDPSISIQELRKDAGLDD